MTYNEPIRDALKDRESVEQVYYFKYPDLRVLDGLRHELRLQQNHLERAELAGFGPEATTWLREEINGLEAQIRRVLAVGRLPG